MDQKKNLWIKIYGFPKEFCFLGILLTAFRISPQSPNEERWEQKVTKRLGKKILFYAPNGEKCEELVRNVKVLLWICSDSPQQMQSSP